MNLTHYPSGPARVAPSVTEPSAAFKAEVKKVMTSIISFFIVYVLLILLSVALAAVCVWLGVAVISNVGHWLGIVAGVGIISIGIMVFIFLVKFIFSVKKFDESGSIEVTEKDQPQLFSFIRQLTKDTETSFPKKIILSPEVNACVFYNDSFWSMIFPVRKNLQIGLGLVNTLTLSEFKAVMAHEFGHFSQRSMKLGSFVYNVNKVIYNMLYENRDYAGFLQGFGNLHSVLSFFVNVTIRIVQGIQYVLQKMYGFINKNYMALSREMEFHADAVAASVSGSNNMVTALRKVELSDMCYNSVIQKANEYLERKQVFDNVYDKHHVVMKKYADDFKLPLQQNVPLANDEFFKQFQLSKVNIKDQWASHPSREDREDQLKQLDLDAPVDETSTWVLFAHPEKLQSDLTAILYRNVGPDMKEKMMTEQEFRENWLEETTLFRLPEEYNGYYNNRKIDETDPDKIIVDQYKGEINRDTMNNFFSAENTALPKMIAANQSDARLLQAIINKQVDSKTFDYDGKKYDKEAAPGLLQKLDKEIEEQKKQLQQLDQLIFSFFIKAASLKNKEVGLKIKYREYFENERKVDKFFESGRCIMNSLAPLLQGQQMGLDDARKLATELRGESRTVKPILSFLLEKGILDKKPVLKEKAERFIKAEYLYFADNSFMNTELSDIHQLATDISGLLIDFQFLHFKKILEYQLELVD